MKITRWVSLCAWTLVALAALVAARVQRRPRRLTWLLGVAGGSGLVAVFCFEDKLWPWLGNGAMLVLTLSTACLVVAFRWRELDGGAWPESGGRAGWWRASSRRRSSVRSGPGLFATRFPGPSASWTSLTTDRGSL